MTVDKVVEIIQKEKECVSRQQCDRKCEKCDLVMKAEDILDAYNYVLKRLEALQEWLKIKESVHSRK